MDSIRARVTDTISIITNDLAKATGKVNPVVNVARSFGGSKVPQCLQVDHSHQAIVGGSYLDHFIDTRGKSEEDVKSLLQSDSPIVRAKEAKLCVMSIQNPGVGHSPSYTIGAYPH